MTIFRFEAVPALIVAALAAYVLIRVLLTIPGGIIRIRNGGVYARSDRPVAYWGVVAFIIFVGGSLIAFCVLGALGYL